MTDYLPEEDLDLTDIDLRALPKVSLHDHLDGGLRPSTIIELAEQIGHELPANDAESLRAWFVESADSGSLERYLETFDHTIAVMQSAEALTRVAREFVADLVEDGVLYAEVRWAPEQHTKGGLSMDEAVDAIQVGIEQGMYDASEAGSDIIVGQLICAMRQADNALEVAELALRHRDRGVIGFDIAGPEDGFPPSRLREAFDLLAQNLFPTTVHAGEAAGLESITDAIAVGRALRLGHGVRIAEDITVTNDEQTGDVVAEFGRVASWVHDRRIALEVCPSSNLQTGAVAQFGSTIAEHPIDLLIKSGFRVTVNTDNRLISNTTLSDEFELLINTFGYTLTDVLDLTLDAVDASFAPDQVRIALADVIFEAYMELIDGPELDD